MFSSCRILVLSSVGPTIFAIFLRTLFVSGIKLKRPILVVKLVCYANIVLQIEIEGSGWPWIVRRSPLAYTILCTRASLIITNVRDPLSPRHVFVPPRFVFSTLCLSVGRFSFQFALLVCPGIVPHTKVSVLCRTLLQTWARLTSDPTPADLCNS